MRFSRQISSVSLSKVGRMGAACQTCAKAGCIINRSMFGARIKGCWHFVFWNHWASCIHNIHILVVHVCKKPCSTTLDLWYTVLCTFGISSRVLVILSSRFSSRPFQSQALKLRQSNLRRRASVPQTSSRRRLRSRMFGTWSVDPVSMFLSQRKQRWIACNYIHNPELVDLSTSMVFQTFRGILQFIW